MNDKLTELPNGYIPSEKEEYMNVNQLEYFRRKLFSWKEEVLNNSKESFEELKDNNEAGGDSKDEGDSADSETNRQLSLRKIDRDNKLIKQIDSALDRIKNGTFGYCIVTGDKIGIARLEVRPIAKMTIEAQEEHEEQEKFRED